MILYANLNFINILLALYFDFGKTIRKKLSRQKGLFVMQKFGWEEPPQLTNWAKNCMMNSLLSNPSL